MLPRVVALWLLPRYAGGSLPGPLRGAVRAAIAGDAAVALAYDALRRAERHAHRAASGSAADGAGSGGLSGGLSGGQKDLLLQGIFAGLDADGDAAGAETARGRSPARWSPGGAPLAAAAACVGLFAILPGEPVGDPTVDHAVDDGVDDGVDGAPDDLAARGLGEAPLGVRIRCVRNDVVIDDASAGARQTGAALDCPAGALLAFSTTNLHAAERFAFVVGVDDAGDRVWLPPFGPASDALALAAGHTDDVLDTLAPVPLARDGRALTLFVLLDDAPFSAIDVERRLDGAARSGVPLARLDRLPVDVAAQGRLLLRSSPPSTSP